jgi:hypothetical protein
MKTRSAARWSLAACVGIACASGFDLAACGGGAGGSPGESTGPGAETNVDAGGSSVGGSSGGSDAADASAGGVESPSDDGGAIRDAGSSAGDAGAAAGSCAKWLGDAGAVSAWVYTDPSGSLAYQTTARGDRILDFSYAGYMGGGVALPVVPTAKTVTALAGDAGDDTSAIQAALDAVAAMPLVGGFRGAVELAPGTFHLATQLAISASGMVLRGAGSGANGSSLVMTGSTHTAIVIQGTGSYAATSTPASITDAYVPSGAMSFHVSDASGFAVGDAILVRRPITTAWVALMGMDKLESSSDAGETWLKPGGTIDTDRTIAAIAGNAVTLDAPLTDSFDSTVLSPPGGSIVKYTFAGRVSQIGVEHLRLIGPAVDIPIADPQYSGFALNDVVDAWLSDVAVEDTQGAFTVSGRAKRVTLDRVSVTHTIPHTGDNMADYSISGTQTLVSSATSVGTGEWPIVTQGEETGPIVALKFTSNQPSGISPHQRWATGLLADSCAFPNSPKGTPGVAFWDRGTHGSGQGWTVGWAVAWNVSSPFLLVQQPPGSQNWCIGCTGEIVVKAPAGSSTTPPNGVFDSPGKSVTPGSLYLAQLCERLGPQAVVNVGY